MGLFSRHGSSKSHSRNASNSMVIPKGLEPVLPVARQDGKGDTTQVSTGYFDVGVTSDCNSRYRKTMEDYSIVIMDFMEIPGCAYFGVYDGHAGSQCASMVAENLHGIVAETITEQSTPKDIPLALSTAFQKMDGMLRNMDIKHSGSTAVVAISCYMNAAGDMVSQADSGVERKLFVANVGDSRAVLGTVAPNSEAQDSVMPGPAAPNAASDQEINERPASEPFGGSGEAQKQSQQPPQGQHHTSPHSHQTHPKHQSTESLSEETSSMQTVADTEQVGAIDTKRLSYDHRCGDIYEQKRVANAGGIMINNRVNGMLAVTRSLGDLFMKDYVVGAPYTTESVLNADSSNILVMACDGLWDVCSDDKSLQLAYSVIKEGKSALVASKELLDHALAEFSVDNLTIMVVQFKNQKKN